MNYEPERTQRLLGQAPEQLPERPVPSMTMDDKVVYPNMRVFTSEADWATVVEVDHFIDAQSNVDPRDWAWHLVKRDDGSPVLLNRWRITSRNYVTNSPDPQTVDPYERED